MPDTNSLATGQTQTKASPGARVKPAKENSSDCCQDNSPPDGRVERGEHGRGRMAKLVESRGANQDSVDDEDGANEKPDGKHVRLLGFVHEIDGDSAGGPAAIARRLRLCVH